MDYNEELQELIKRANKNGYEFINGKFEKLEEMKFPVMETFFINNGVYEDTGYWNIYKKTVRISEEEYKNIIKYANKNDFKEIICKYNADIDDNFYEKIIETIYKYDESRTEITECNKGGIITLRYDDSFEVYDGEESECVDLWFTKEDDNCDFPRGYISFYKISLSDFKKVEDINIDVEKFMKYN